MSKTKSAISKETKIDNALKETNIRLANELITYASEEKKKLRDEFIKLDKELKSIINNM